MPTRAAELAVILGLFPDLSRDEAATPSKAPQEFKRQIPIGTDDKIDEAGLSIRPIRQAGVVIDHMIPYSEEVLLKALKVRERRDVYRAGTVRSVSRPDNVKGMLIIEDRAFTDDELQIIAAVSPGCRVSTINEGRVVEKIELSLPEKFDGVPGIRCLNPGCISRPEHMEHCPAKLVKAGEKILRCHYCSNVMSASEANSWVQK